MGRVLPIVVAIALAVYAVIDCTQTDSRQIRSLNRPVWIVIILLLPFIGPIVWLTLAKGSPKRKPKPQTPPVAPDDDPEFLQQIRDIDDRHEKMLGDWEADLRKREEELRRRKDDDAS